ncbi:bromodomain-containing protein DDB_G0270170-like [Cotesia glomerata]|uniref:bromodomain-containing protein DDB_G0270170-like n=1 Tax=Cotesia glomerata TaxID=32391 RepID=UPI001D010FB9|nr:bromodomain-containing protein DDB_G0270170-like [Cotesia glomerata]
MFVDSEEMIGPSSEMSNESETVRGKRRTFDELDIDSFCEEICQSTKKHHSMELNDDPMDISVATSSFPLVASIQEPSSNPGSVARLEVLVVDGTWDMENFEKSDFIQLESSDIIEPEILNDAQNITGDFETVLSYWEVPEEQVKVNSINKNNKNNNNNSNRNNTNNFHQNSVNKSNRNFNDNNQLDEEDGNLSWLLDFKLDSLIEAPDDKIITTTKSRQPFNCSDNASMYQSLKKSLADESVQKQPSVPSGLLNNPKYSERYGGLKKPPFTYTELIEHALQERGELTVSAIYQWISEHFPYYKSNDDRWKNSVRHNLSINPHFRKGSKAPHGAGHLWTIANRNEMRPRPLLTNIPGISGRQSKSIADNDARNNVTIDEVAAATASITQPEVLSPISLEHCAEQILNGIKKEVQVQYLMPIMTVQREDPETGHRHLELSANKQTGTDFLNPVAKEVVAEECGLIGESYLVTDLNPSALGLNFIEPETITPDHLFGEELSFQFYELTSPSQLQSA